MKRLMILLLSVVIMVACLPTPEQEYIINKGDNTVEDKINATPASTVEIGEVQIDQSEAKPVGALDEQRFPNRWDEDAVAINDHVSISVHAEIIQKEDGLYPVYRIKDAPLTDEMAREIVTKILDRPVEAYTSEATKEDIQLELKRYLDDLAELQKWVDDGKPDDGIGHDDRIPTQEEIDATTKAYMDRINNAPDTLESKPVADYQGLHMNTQTAYSLESGSKAFVSFYEWGFSVYKDCSYYGTVYTEEMHQEAIKEKSPNTKLWHDVSMERSAAEAILNRELARLEITGFGTYSAEPGCFCERSQSEELTYRSNGWLFKLRRNPSGYPMTNLPWEPSQYLRYGSGDGFASNKLIQEESIVVFIDESGLEMFELYNRKEMIGMPNANVELIPFDEMQRIAKNTITACLPYDLIGERDAKIEIYKAMLTTYTLRVKNSDEYYEMPCWVLFFDGLFGGSEAYRMHERDSAQTTHDALVLNAVDGSIVHTDYGY